MFAFSYSKSYKLTNFSSLPPVWGLQTTTDLLPRQSDRTWNGANLSRCYGVAGDARIWMSDRNTLKGQTGIWHCLWTYPGYDGSAEPEMERIDSAFLESRQHGRADGWTEELTDRECFITSSLSYEMAAQNNSKQCLRTFGILAFTKPLPIGVNPYIIFLVLTQTAGLWAVWQTPWRICFCESG